MTSMSQQVLQLADALVVFDNHDLTEALGPKAKGVASTLRQRNQIIPLAYGVFGRVGATADRPEFDTWLERMRARRDARANEEPAAAMIMFLRESGQFHRPVDIEKAIGYPVHQIISQYAKRGILQRHPDGSFAYNEAGDRPMPVATEASRPQAEAWSEDHVACLAALDTAAMTTSEIADATSLPAVRVANIMTRLVTDQKVIRFPCVTGKQHHFYALPVMNAAKTIGQANLTFTYLKMIAAVDGTTMWGLESHKLEDAAYSAQQLVGAGLVTMGPDKQFRATPEGFRLAGITPDQNIDPRLFRPRSLAILEKLEPGKTYTTMEIAALSNEQIHPMREFIRLTLVPAGGLESIGKTRRKFLRLTAEGFLATGRK